MLETGYKFTFDPKYQRLTQIEVFVDLNKLRAISHIHSVPDMLIGSSDTSAKGEVDYVGSQDFSIYQRLSLKDVNSLLGSTFQPSVNGKFAILRYPGIKFLFKYMLPDN
mmetsp:Transcript_1605/g.2125  ORF Transcript_1605/g.2125 Transcript_1605/m.2125 type:complete len:109 (+) Transcript_1605:182-508(+)